MGRAPRAGFSLVRLWCGVQIEGGRYPGSTRNGATGLGCDLELVYNKAVLSTRERGRQPVIHKICLYRQIYRKQKKGIYLICPIYVRFQYHKGGLFLPPEGDEGRPQAGVIVDTHVIAHCQQTPVPPFEHGIQQSLSVAALHLKDRRWRWRWN